MSKKLSMTGLFVFAALLQGCYVTDPARPVVVQREVVRPDWAPQYENVEQTQYYYLPDIEVYYDVWNHEYVYLDNGSWIYASSLPPMYADYDMYNGHVVVLDYRVHQPWMHHEEYVAHYPRYYYHSVYPRTEANPDHPRGYNENERRPMYDNTVHAPRNGGGSNAPSTAPRGDQHPVVNSPRNNTPPAAPPAPMAPQRNTPPPAPRNAPVPSNTGRMEPASSPRAPQPVQYRGRGVGQPVPVTKNMMRPR